jgi:hypothetical protein
MRTPFNYFNFKSSAWKPFLMTILSLVIGFKFTGAQVVYNFTNCGATGQYGPTQTQINATYTSTNTLYNGVTSSSGIQLWTVPSTGDYLIESYGAQGGNGTGLGAKISGTFNLTAGTVLKIVVGQMGVGTAGKAGGGGSFVVKPPYNSNASILTIAGGGGHSNSNNSRMHGQSTTAGGASELQAAVTNGSGGRNQGCIGGGGGFFTNGDIANAANDAGAHGKAFAYGCNGGTGVSGVVGGFGGGAGITCGPANWCAGGGGYSGGAGGGTDGGGGGSYNTGSAQTNVTGFNSGHGAVVITRLYSVSIAETATILCSGDNTAALAATGNGGTIPYTFSWSTGATTSSISGLTAGTYTVTMTDAASSTTTATYTVTQPTTLVSSASLVSTVFCYNGNDGAASSSATGGTGTYTYSWNNGAITASLTGVTAGTYSVTITDANGCTDSSSVSIAQPAIGASTTISAQTNVLCNGASTGAAAATTSGGTPPYTYAWSTGATTVSTATSSITGLAAGTYGVTATDANGCASTATATITEPGAIVIPTLTRVTVTCNGLANGTLTAVPSGGVPPYTYAWSNASISDTATGLAIGTYTVTVTDANGCAQTASREMTQPTVVSASIASQVNVSCNGGANGSATATSTGGTGTKTYAWSNGATGVTATGLAAGTYTVTATDANGCTATASATITEPTAVSVTISSQNVLCNGASTGSATATATGGTPNYTYSWSNGAAVATATGLAAGTYSVTATDANGCTSTASVTITELTAVSVTISSQNVLCNGASTGSATVSASGGIGGYAYLWSNAATTASITGIAAGTYGVTIYNIQGCAPITDSVTITEPTAVIAPITSQVNVTCNGGSDGSATVNATGGTGIISYAWSNGDIVATATGLSAGTYTVTATDINGCTTTASATITEPSALVASISSQSNVLCNGGSTGSATASAAGGTGLTTYLWSNGDNVATAIGLAAGTYTVTATDANGCTATASATITEPTLLVASSVVDSNVTCNGFSNGGATASATGGVFSSLYTYTWSNAATTASITGVAAGNYAVTITDVNGCSDTTSVVVAEPVILSSSVSIDSNVSCNGLSNGGANAIAVGGTAPYTYNWSNAATTASITGVAAGTYTVTITDTNGCSSIATDTVFEPAILVSTSIVDSNVTCNGLVNGGASATAVGGTTPYTYAWSNAATTAAVTGLVAGTYSVTISDANGCTNTSTSTVTEPAVLTSVVAIDSNATCNGFANGGATATATGGTAPYAYAWSNASTSASITGIAAGTYTVTITDTNGCTSTATDSVSEPMALMAMITVDSNVLCNGGTDAGVTVMATGGTPGYAYTWNNASTTASITGLTAGEYTVMVMDTNNCMVSVSDTITEPTALAIMMNMDATVACFGTATGTASAMVSGGVAPYAYNWSNGDTAAMATGLNAATYMVMATDSNGCMIMDSIMIAGPASAMTVSVNETSGIVCDGDATGALEATANGGWGVYSFEWNTTETTSAISGLTEGSYSVNVTDSLGCMETASESIVHQFELPVVNLGADTTICNNASIEINAGNDGAAYAWSTTESAQTIVVSDSGSYSVMVIDINGCMNTDTIMISLDDCIGINELGTELHLMVYPNPSRGVFQIESNGFNLNESTVTIIDLVGNLVTTIRPQGAVRETITLNQSSGVYFLSIEVDGNVAQQRIIIQ